jgi:hypothetical protein
MERHSLDKLSEVLVSDSIANQSQIVDQEVILVWHLKNLSTT